MAGWLLTALESGRTVASEGSIDILNEQVIGEYGFSLSIGQSAETGDRSQESNGAIGIEFEYADPAAPWLNFVTDGANPFYDFVLNEEDEQDFETDPRQMLSTSFAGVVPFIMTRFGIDANNPYISPAWIDRTAGMQIVRTRSFVEQLNNVDLVFTSDKSKWSRCVIVESASPFFFDPPNLGGAGFNTEDNRLNFDLRGAPSVSRQDADGDGKPDPDGDGEGMGWFPGYAVDVESGKRLNVFFGENSIYNDDFFSTEAAGEAIGADMMWNPDERISIQTTSPSIALLHTSGQHFIYVTNQEYDGCTFLRERLAPSPLALRKTNALRDVTWTAIPFTNGSLTSYAEGLIPNDLTVKLRVDNPYQVAQGTGANNGHPSYRFTIAAKAADDLIEAGDASVLDAVNVVPNPYLAFSSYETSQFTTIVKVTNLPPRCIVTIFSLDGKFIRQYRRDEEGIPQTDRSNPGILQTQVTPDLEWDLKNSRGIPIASGVYLIHINGFELGERTLKWFGINRKFDPAGL